MPVPSTAYCYDFKILENEQVAPQMMRLRLECPELARSIEPGQFMNLRVPGDPSEILRLPFSWSCKDAEAGWVEFAYLVIGKGTERLAGLRVGTTSDLLGPAGNGWQVPARAKRAMVVGGGSGVVPVVPLVGALRKAGVACDFVQGAPTAARVIYEKEICEGGAELFISTDDGTRGTHGFTTAVAEKLLGERDYDVVFTCGPQPMMRGIWKLAQAHGVACQVSMEKLMACGFGVCTTCLCETIMGRKGACMDGPVFDAAEVIW